MLRLYYAQNACSLASHIVLEDAGADYEAIRVSFADGEQRKADYLKINPKGRVPALATDRGVLTESPAILSYIAKTHPGAKLAPDHDPFAFAQMEAFNLYLASTLHVAFAHAFRPERYADGEAAIAAVRAKAPDAVAACFDLIEDRFSDGRPWALGEDYSTSDPYLFVFTRWLHRDGMPELERFPLIAAHAARMNGRPAVQTVLEHEGLKPL